MSQTARRLTWGQALAWRMGRHRLIERAAPSEMLRVVSEIGGLHAQVMSSAELSLWARIDGLQRDAVHEALWRRRTLVKLWAMRGTLHLLPTAELGTWLAALGTQTKVGNVGNAAIDALAVAVGRALDGRMLTREELALEVERSTGSAELAEWVRFSWGSYLKAASFRGLLCFGPSERGRVTFTSPAAWTPGAIVRPEPMEALREVTRRFLGAYGPATADDLMRWWEGPPSPRRGARMIAALGGEAVEVDVEGRRAWALAGDMDDVTRAEPPDEARLLPAFDPWVIGAARGLPVLLEPQYNGRVYRPQGWISPVVLVNGRMAGVWRHARKGRRLVVEIEPFEASPAWARAQVEDEAGRLAAFLGGELELQWTGRGAGRVGGDGAKGQRHEVGTRFNKRWHDHRSDDGDGMREPLRLDLTALPAARRGHFLLESGHHGDLWLDLELLFLRPRAIRPFARELAQRLSPYRIEAVCGPLVEGAFVGQLVAAELDVAFAYADRVTRPDRDGLYPVDYHIPEVLRATVRGKAVAIVNDVINAGSAVRGAFVDVRACGAEPVAVGALLTLGSWASRFAAEQGILLETIDSWPNQVWAPAACPLCAAGTPLDNGDEPT